MILKNSVACIILLGGNVNCSSTRFVSREQINEEYMVNFSQNQDQKLFQICFKLCKNLSTFNNPVDLFDINMYSQLNIHDLESSSELTDYLKEIIETKCATVPSIHEALKFAFGLMFKCFAKETENLISTLPEQAPYLEAKVCINGLCAALAARSPANLSEFTYEIYKKFTYFETQLEKITTEPIVINQAKVCSNLIDLYVRNFGTDNTKLGILQSLAPVAIPENPSSEIITQALNALCNILRHFQLSIVFGPITFQQIFSAYNLKYKLTSYSSLSDYEASLGNLGFSILYKLYDESPETFMEAYSSMRKFMDESGRQSVLEHFVNAYPEWLPEKQEKFTAYFDDIYNDIKTVRLAKRYHAVLGEKAKEFLGFAMLQAQFTTKEIISLSAHGHGHGLPGLGARFFKFPETPTNDDERIAAWTANRELIATLPVDTYYQEIADMVNDIELSDAEAIWNINMRLFCTLLRCHEQDFNQATKWINLIWSKLRIADAKRLVENLDDMPFSARLTFSPRSAFPLNHSSEDMTFLEKFMYGFSNFSPSEMRNEFEQTLQSFVKEMGGVPHDNDHHRVLMGALHFYSEKGNSEMTKPLTDYFLQDPSCLDYLGNWNLPVNSSVWAGSLGVAYVNFAFGSDMDYCTPTLIDWIIYGALLRKNETFLRQLKIPAARIIMIACECGAIPLCYSKDQLEMALSDRISGNS